MAEARTPGACRSALLVHGAGGGGWEWNLWRGVLEAEGFEVAAPDLQPVAAGIAGTRLADYTSQVGLALQALPRPRALVGASLGGLLALLVASQADAIVLVNPLPPKPWNDALPARDWSDVVTWRRDARLARTRGAMPDADDASALHAFRNWRDESGAVLREAHAGIEVPRPAARMLCIVSELDTDVPFDTLAGFARDWRIECWPIANAGHVGPLLGREATRVAARAARWLSRG